MFLCARASLGVGRVAKSGRSGSLPLLFQFVGAVVPVAVAVAVLCFVAVSWLSVVYRFRVCSLSGCIREQRLKRTAFRVFFTQAAHEKKPSLASGHHQPQLHRPSFVFSFLCSLF